MAVYVLDRFYLVITLLVTIGFQLLGFTVAWTLQFDKITDVTGGSNFFFLALLTLLMGGTFHTRNIVASIFVMIWAFRIGAFLLFRVLKTGGDKRFDEIRSHFFKFLGFWIGQIFWVWTVSLPVVILNSPAVSDVGNGGSNPAFGTSRDIAGSVMWAVGLILETTGDIQKFRHKSSKSSPKDRPITRGVWAWSRHPPYFGEMLCWWGIWTLCLSPSTNGSLNPATKSAQYGAVLSPIFTVLLLMFASGIPTAEKPQAKKFYLMSFGPNARDEDINAWREYKSYLCKTSILIPLPPALYQLFPKFIKRSVLLDFPFYQFAEATDGAAAIEDEAQNYSAVA